MLWDCMDAGELETYVRIDTSKKKSMESTSFLSLSFSSQVGRTKEVAHNVKERK